jgi:hypothetical protein
MSYGVPFGIHLPAGQAAPYSAHDHRSQRSQTEARPEAQALRGREANATLDLTTAEMFAIAQGAASLPGQWSAISQCGSDGVTYAGLIGPGTEQVSILIGRDIEGLYVVRASGQIVARGCASVTDALTAVRWSLRQG